MAASNQDFFKDQTQAEQSASYFKGFQSIMKRKSDESRTPSQIKLSTRQKTQEDSESLYDLQLCDQDLGDIQLNMSIRSKDLRKNLNFDDSEFGADLSEVERPTFRQTPQVLDPLLQDLDVSIKES